MIDILLNFRLAAGRGWTRGSARAVMLAAMCAAAILAASAASGWPAVRPPEAAENPLTEILIEWSRTNNALERLNEIYEYDTRRNHGDR